MPLNAVAPIDQPPIFPFVTFSVRASIFPAVMREAFTLAMSSLEAVILPAAIRSAEIVPAVICEAVTVPV